MVGMQGWYDTACSIRAVGIFVDRAGAGRAIGCPASARSPPAEPYAPHPAHRSTAVDPPGDHLQYSTSGPPRELAALKQARLRRFATRPQTLRFPCFEAAADERQTRCGASGCFVRPSILPPRHMQLSKVKVALGVPAATPHWTHFSAFGPLEELDRCHNCRCL